MKRRYLITAAFLAACVCLALGILAMMPQGPGVTRENFDRIKKGMTRAQVEAIFGELPWFEHQQCHHLADWRHENGRIGRVIFADGIVMEMFWFESNETFSEQLRRWLHLPPE